MYGLHLGILAFTIVLATGLRWFQLVYAVALPQNRGGFLASMLLGVACAIAALLQSPGIIGAILASLAIFLGSFFVFTWTISAQKGGSDALQPGQQILHFTTPDHLGERFDSRALDGRPVLLKFFRGHW